MYQAMFAEPHPFFYILNDHFPHHREMTTVNRCILGHIFAQGNFIHRVVRHERRSRQRLIRVRYYVFTEYEFAGHIPADLSDLDFNIRMMRLILL